MLGISSIMPPELSRLAEIAESLVGLREQPAGSNKGPDLKPIFAADNYKPNAADNGYPWCASFVCYCFQLWLQNAEAKARFPRIKRPTTASAFGLIDWAYAQGGAVQVLPGTAEPNRSDIVIFKISHCGIVTRRLDASTKSHPTFQSVEGNTSGTENTREGYIAARRGHRPHEVKAFLRLVPVAHAVQPKSTGRVLPSATGLTSSRSQSADSKLKGGAL